MNRNFPEYSTLSQEEKQRADTFMTSYLVWAAILNIATDSRPADVIWEDPTDTEYETIEMMLNEWAIQGDIDPGVFAWGLYNIEVKAE